MRYVYTLVLLKHPGIFFSISDNYCVVNIPFDYIYIILTIIRKNYITNVSQCHNYSALKRMDENLTVVHQYFLILHQYILLK